MGLLVFILAIFAVRNLPWHLDDYDQAKQAYVSFEMVKGDAWLFQHTPSGKVATKPPLAGWLSAALYTITGSWELAWRLPVFASALLLLALLWKEGGWLAGAVFALNAFTPRLATLVRTDMLLALWLTLIGWMIYSKLKDPWTGRDYWLLFGAVLGSMLTKGPIVYAFLLPGLVAFCLFTRTSRPWGTWWPWLLPLLVFGAWAGYGILTDPAFYQQVVLKEFAGRFDASETAVHDPKPLYAYLAKLLPMFGPWSWLLLAAPFIPAVRQLVRQRRELLWLVCWIVGALVLMSLIPSKRADRIFPIVPPCALLLAQLLPAFPHARRVTAVAVAISVLSTAAYTGWNLYDNHHKNQKALVHFGHAARALAGDLKVVSGKDEGMLLYTGVLRFTDKNEALRLWSSGAIDWLVLPNREWEKNQAKYLHSEAALRSGSAPEKNSAYVLIRRL